MVTKIQLRESDGKESGYYSAGIQTSHVSFTKNFCYLCVVVA